MSYTSVGPVSTSMGSGMDSESDAASRHPRGETPRRPVIRRWVAAIPIGARRRAAATAPDRTRTRRSSAPATRSAAGRGAPEEARGLQRVAEDARGARIAVQPEWTVRVVALVVLHHPHPPVVPDPAEQVAREARVVG